MDNQFNKKFNEGFREAIKNGDTASEQLKNLAKFFAQSEYVHDEIKPEPEKLNENGSISIKYIDWLFEF
jgi:hypothetical protein